MLPTDFQLQGVVPGHRHNFWSILSQVLFPGVENLNARMDGTKNLLRGKPLCPRAAGQSSCLLKHSNRSCTSVRPLHPQPLHISSCLYPGVEHCCFCAADGSLKWYCLARKINQRLMAEQSRFKSTSSGCFQLISASHPIVPCKESLSSCQKKTCLNVLPGAECLALKVHSNEPKYTFMTALVCTKQHLAAMKYLFCSCHCVQSDTEALAGPQGTNI